MGQLLGHVFEMGDPHSKHHSPGFKPFAIVELEKKSSGQTIETSHELLLKFGHHPVPEGKPICSKSIKTYRTSVVGVLDPLFCAEALKSKVTARVGDVGRKPIRFEHHTLGHMR